MDGLTFSERDALLRDLSWSGESISVGDGPPQAAWTMSLSLVFIDVGIEEVFAPLSRWCVDQPNPGESARLLATLAVYASPDDPAGKLLVFAARA